MPWTERQIAMLGEMGLRLWKGAPSPAVPAAPVPVPTPTPTPTPIVAERALARAPAPAPAVAANPAPAPSAVPVPIAATAGLGWAELRAAVAACRACTLCETRTQTVFGVGHHESPWMVVGEAPGEQEDLKGEPFVGAAGELLDAMLRALALSRSEDAAPAQRVYIANTLKCRPPRNRNPAPEELACCEPFLVRQIELLRPRIILAMGRFAVQALLRSAEPIGRLRGRVHEYQGVPLVVTYHPAYLLRNLPDKAKAWQDLLFARSTYRRLLAEAPA